MKHLKHFAESRVNKLKRLAGEYQTVRDPKTLHSIRVQIKKIKAVLLTIGNSRKKFKAHRNYLPFRSMFRKAGAIRDPEVLSQLLISHNIHGVPVDFLPEKPKAEERFLDDIPVFLQHLKKVKKKLVKEAGKIGRKDFQNFVDETKREVKHGLYPKLIAKDLHNTRKAIKNILYLSAVEKSPGKKYLKFLNQLEGVIGNWHDKQTLLDLTENHPDARRLLMSLSEEDKSTIASLAKGYYEK